MILHSISRRQGKISLNGNSFFFYTFLFLMIFAKGVGLDSGDTLYFVLAIVAILFWLIHILLVRWEQRELLYSVVLFSLAALVTVITRRTGIILSIMAMIAVKGINKEKYMSAVLKGWFLCVVMMVLLVFCGVVTDEIVLQNGKVCYGMGYGSENMFHAVSVILMILYLYHRGDKSRSFEFLLVFILNYIVYNYSTSRSGLIMGSVAVLLSYIIKFAKKSKRTNRWLVNILCLVMILIVMLSFVIPLMHDGDYWGNKFPNVLNRLLTGRVLHSKTVLTKDSITLFGNSGDLSAFVDNAYVYLLMKYGLIMTMTIIGLYVVAIKSMIQRNDMQGLYMIFLFVLYGFTEQFFVNSFMNYSLLLVGNEVMNVILRKGRRQIDVETIGV